GRLPGHLPRHLQPRLRLAAGGRGGGGVRDGAAHPDRPHQRGRGHLGNDRPLLLPAGIGRRGHGSRTGGDGAQGAGPLPANDWNDLCEGGLMRILARFHAYPPRHNAGAEWAAHSLLRELAAHGHEVEVWLSEVTGSRHPFDLDGVRVIPQTTHNAFAAAVRKGGVVVSHLENVRNAASAARGWGKPLVVLCHNTFPATFRAIGSGTTALAVYNSEWMAQEADRFWETNPKAVRPLREIVVRPPVRAADYRTTPGDRITLINLHLNKGSDLFWKLAELMPERQFLAVRGSYGEQDVREMPNVEVIDNVPGADMA